MIDVETYGAAVGAAKRYTDEHSGGSDDAVKYTEQSLTSEQQAQARTNIGAANAADVPTAEQQAAWSAKQDALTFDSAPTLSSANPVTSDGVYTAVDAVNERCDDIIDIISGKPIVYGFHVNPDESDPSDAVTYLADAVGMTPASMGSTTFNYGSWKDAFFMPKPCMLKYDGTFGGNAMMEFPKSWLKAVFHEMDDKKFFQKHDGEWYEL